MLKEMTAASLAFHDLLNRLVTQGQQVPGVVDASSVGSAFGTKRRDTREMLLEGFRLPNPRVRLVPRGSPPLSFRYMVGSFLWMMSGSNLRSDIEPYGRRASQFATRDGQLEGAVGRRIVGLGRGGPLSETIGLLKEDSTSRRAVIPIFSTEDLVSRPLDTPCTIALHVVVRSGALDMVVYMRSQSVLMILPYDVFAFTMLQELIAAELEVRLGSYYHIATSMHLYEDEVVAAAAELAGGVQELRPMVAMPRNAFEQLQRALACERALRGEGVETSLPRIVEQHGVDAYWGALLATLVEPNEANAVMPAPLASLLE